MREVIRKGVVALAGKDHRRRLMIQPEGQATEAAAEGAVRASTSLPSVTC
jgi:hypothetical protein